LITSNSLAVIELLAPDPLQPAQALTATGVFLADIRSETFSNANPFYGEKFDL